MSVELPVMLLLPGFRLLVGGVFLLASLAKIRSRNNQFLQAMLGYDLLPQPLAKVVARGLPVVEALVGTLLVVGLWNRVAAIGGFGLLAVFSSALSLSLLRGKTPKCGCFGSLAPIQWRLAYRNLLLMALLLPIYAYEGGTYTLERLLFARPDPASPVSSDVLALIGGWCIALIAILFLHIISSVNQRKGGTHS